LAAAAAAAAAAVLIKMLFSATDDGTDNRWRYRKGVAAQ